MDEVRRNLLRAVVPAALLAGSGRLLALAQEPQSPPSLPGQSAPPQSRGPLPFPDDTNPNPNAPKIDMKKLLKHNQTQMQEDVDRLYELATELKSQVDGTDSSEVLSLALLRKAEEVEKLAHQIRGLAKG
jgi:hypothetical protein